MASLQRIKGTYDVMGEDILRHRHVEETAREVSSRYGFGEISTPIFEATDVFARTLGDTSDIVTKEMYTFETKGGDLITLRPEGTAGVARAFISEGLAQAVPLKLFYRGPMFRYERPQKGRQRQFHQVGVELLGVAQPLADIEVILLGAQLLEELGLKDKVQLELNSLGDTESRNAYRSKLVDYLDKYKNDLSKDSQERLGKNPMRILDSKDEGDKKIVADAPLMADSLNDEACAFFDKVQEGLTLAGLAYNLNSRLVRGLDYYCHTAFEFTTDLLGAQSAVLAGGRYDGLIKQMGGAPTPGVGWAAGVERLSMLYDGDIKSLAPIAMVPLGDACEKKAIEIAQQLRKAGFCIDLGYSGNMKKRMNRANKAGAVAVVILGDDELGQGVATVRDMETGDQTPVGLDHLADHLARYR